MVIQAEEKKNYTPEEYLELEVNAEQRHEYINSEIIPMTGGTPNHNQIAGNFYMVVQGELQLQEGRRDTIINPLMIAEVLSESTSNYDKDEKFLADRTISTFQEYLLIDQYQVRIEQFFKIDNKRWSFVEYDDINETLSLNSISFQISLTDIYDKVEFEQV